MSRGYCGGCGEWFDEVTPCKCGKFSIRDSAAKADTDKPRLDLVPPEAMTAMGRVLTFGAAKYAARNWEQGMSWGRIVAALLRHLFAWIGGEDQDPESGFSHLDHVICNAAFLVTYEARGVGEDDRSKRVAAKAGPMIRDRAANPILNDITFKHDAPGPGSEGGASMAAPCADCHQQFGEYCLRACPFGKKAKPDAD